MLQAAALAITCSFYVLYLTFHLKTNSKGCCLPVVRYVVRQSNEFKYMIIVSGKNYVEVENRNLFIYRSLETMKAARQQKGCKDFIAAPGPIEKNRVNIYEEWESEEELAEFRGSGPDSDISSLIVSAKVSRHIVV